MPRFLWDSAVEKEREWLFAKEKLGSNGRLSPNGSKLRRKDHPEALNHSFMVIDNRIIALSGKGIYLRKKHYTQVKLAEDEVGNLIALKVINKDDGGSNSVRESEIAYDLGIAGHITTRTSNSKSFPTKHYIAYQYLGTHLPNFIHSRSLSLDKCYELCIKISLALYEIHSGRKAKSKNSYLHNDIHWGNLVIDDHEEPHFIDYGRAWKLYSRDEDVGTDDEYFGTDIVNMLLLFFTPIENRDNYHDIWIFGNWLGEYAFSYGYGKPYFRTELQQYVGETSKFYLYVERSDEIECGVFPKVHYMVQDAEHVFQQGVIDLRHVNLTQLPRVKKERHEGTWSYSLTDDDLTRIEDKVLEVANQNNHAISRKNRNEVLFNLLKNPKSFYNRSKVTTALDIAETLTLCRLQLEAYQATLTAQSADIRLEVIQILNSISSELLKLYVQLRSLPSKDSLDKLVKNYIFSHLLTPPKEISADSLDFLRLPLNETQTIKQGVDNLFTNINLARETWRAKNKPISQDEHDKLSQPTLLDRIELEASSTEVISPIVINLEVDEWVTKVKHDSLKPQTPTPVIFEALDTRSSTKQMQIVNEFDVAPTIISYETSESISQDYQTDAKDTIPQAERDFLRELKNLQNTIEEQQNFASTPSLMTIKRQRAQKVALNEARQVVKELQKQFPLTENGERLRSLHHGDALLIRLADICSHTAQGLHFVAKDGAAFSCDIFDATSDTSGTLRRVNYDINMHKLSMQRLSHMASSLEGSGWKKLRNALFALAGLMLLACGILAAIPTGGTSLLLGLGGAAALTAGVGFFASKDTGLARAVSSVQMKVSA